MPGRYTSVVIEADGGSRGNPGNAAYGAVLRDAVTGDVIAERGERIGVATNNVAEYRGLIAGLELYRTYADGARLEARLDSKLVVEQMSGNWKIKHPDMKPLALQAKRIAPEGTRYTWVPREQNKHADRLANEALDAPEGTVIGGPVTDHHHAEAHRVTVPHDEPEELDLFSDPADPMTPSATRTEPRERPSEIPTPPWEQDPPTTLVLVRHGDTDHTRARVFSGRNGSDPALNESGRAQIAATAEWLAPLADESPVLLSSPLRRTRESAAIVADRFGASFDVEEGLVEAGFGDWEGLTYAEVLDRDPEGFTRWLGDADFAPGGTGDALTAVDARVAEARDRILAAYRGRTVVALTHLTPIKLLTQQVLEMPMSSLFRTEVSPASVTVLAWYPDGRPVLRLFNGQPTGDHWAGGFTVR